MTEEKCVIDAVVKNGFETGKIPIGETVDYAELYIQEILRNLNIIIVSTEKAANAAYDEGTENDLYDLPFQFQCKNCDALTDPDDEEDCYCGGICGPFGKVAARVREIQNAYKKIVTANTNIAHLVDVKVKLFFATALK